MTLKSYILIISILVHLLTADRLAQLQIEREFSRRAHSGSFEEKGSPLRKPFSLLPTLFVRSLAFFYPFEPSTGFRPNIIVSDRLTTSSGLTPFEEDAWTSLELLESDYHDKKTLGKAIKGKGRGSKSFDPIYFSSLDLSLSLCASRRALTLFLLTFINSLLSSSMR